MTDNGIHLAPWEKGFSLPERFNMVSLLLERHLEQGRAKRPAIHYQGRAVTYGQLGSLANRVGNGLAGLGIRPGERVILMLHDGLDFVAAFLGAMKIGAVPVPVNVLATPKDWAYFLTDSRAAALFIEGDLLAKAKDVLGRCPDLRRVVCTRGGHPGCLGWEELTAGSSPELAVHPTRALDHSYWLYTSGTTGRPKGVIHLHKDLVHAVETWGRHVVDFKDDDKVYCVSRLFFSYGLNNALYLPLYFGGSVVLSPERPLPETVIDLVEQERPTILFSVPTSYGQMLNHLEETGRSPDFSSLRACISAGEALPAPLYHRWRERFGLELLDGLGSSEVSFIYICNRPGKVKPGSSGLLLPGYQARVLDDDGAEVPAGEVGNLWVKSETLAAGYWNRPRTTAATFQNGWMKTGDRCHQDIDGYYYYFGRADDSLKVSGIWVSPLEVEQALLGHPAVAECAVVGRRDQIGLVKPEAFVTLKQGFAAGDGLAGELKAQVKGTLAPYKYPRWINFMEDLPKTVTGKIQRYKLRARETEPI